MKNNIINLNTIYAFTNETLIKDNIVNAKIINSDEIIIIKLSASRLKLFIKYHKSLLKNNKLKDIPHRCTVLEDINNFRKYFNNYSFAYDLDHIKNIFINHNISLENLYKFIDSSDYLWLKDLDLNLLNYGICTSRNKYHNILIDLKWESIPKEIIYNYPISLLFKFKIDQKGYIQDISEKDKLEIEYSTLIKELMDKDYISLFYDVCEGDPLLDNYLDNYSDYSIYNGYCGNYETYFVFKELLKLYLDGINIYEYKGNYYSYKEFKIMYDLNLPDHSKFINDHINENKAYEDLFKYNKEINILTCRCIKIIHEIDNNNFITHSLGNLKLTFRSINKVNDEITMYLSDFL